MSDSYGLGVFVLVLAVILGGTGLGTLVGAEPAKDPLRYLPAGLHLPLGVTALLASVCLVAGRFFLLDLALLGASLGVAHYGVIAASHLIAGDRRLAPIVMCVASVVILVLLIQAYAEVLGVV